MEEINYSYLSPLPCTKLTLKLGYRIQHKTDILNPLEEKLGGVLKLIGTRKNVLNRIQVALSLRATTE